MNLIPKSIPDFLNCRHKYLNGYSYGLEGNTYGMDVAFDSKLDIDESRMSIVIPFADGHHRDGVGDLLEVGGIDCSRHKTNPVTLFDHGKQISLPIGLTEDPESLQYTVSIDPIAKKAHANVFFYQGSKSLRQPDKDFMAQNGIKEYDHAVFCEQLFDLMTKRYVRAGSIGYQVINAYPLQQDYVTGTPQGLHLLKTLMLECSAVVMPANADTVRKALHLPQVCGKPLSPYLVKSLSPYAQKARARISVRPRPDGHPQYITNYSVPEVGYNQAQQIFQTLRESITDEGDAGPKAVLDTVVHRAAQQGHDLRPSNQVDVPKQTPPKEEGFFGNPPPPTKGIKGSRRVISIKPPTPEAGASWTSEVSDSDPSVYGSTITLPLNDNNWREAVEDARQRVNSNGIPTQAYNVETNQPIKGIKADPPKKRVISVRPPFERVPATPMQEGIPAQEGEVRSEVTGTPDVNFPVYGPPNHAQQYVDMARREVRRSQQPDGLPTQAFDVRTNQPIKGIKAVDENDNVIDPGVRIPRTGERVVSPDTGDINAPYVEGESAVMYRGPIASTHNMGNPPRSVGVRPDDDPGQIYQTPIMLLRDEQTGRRFGSADEQNRKGIKGDRAIVINRPEIDHKKVQEIRKKYQELSNQGQKANANFIAGNFNDDTNDFFVERNRGRSMGLSDYSREYVGPKEQLDTLVSSHLERYPQDTTTIKNEADKSLLEIYSFLKGISEANHLDYEAKLLSYHFHKTLEDFQKAVQLQGMDKTKLERIRHTPTNEEGGFTQPPLGPEYGGVHAGDRYEAVGDAFDNTGITGITRRTRDDIRESVNTMQGTYGWWDGQEIVEHPYEPGESHPGSPSHDRDDMKAISIRNLNKLDRVRDQDDSLPPDQRNNTTRSRIMPSDQYIAESDDTRNEVQNFYANTREELEQRGRDIYQDEDITHVYPEAESAPIYMPGQRQKSGDPGMGGSEGNAVPQGTPVLGDDPWFGLAGNPLQGWEDWSESIELFPDGDFEDSYKSLSHFFKKLSQEKAFGEMHRRAAKSLLGLFKTIRVGETGKSPDTPDPQAIFPTESRPYMVSGAEWADPADYWFNDGAVRSANQLQGITGQEIVDFTDPTHRRVPTQEDLDAAAEQDAMIQKKGGNNG